MPVETVAQPTRCGNDYCGGMLIPDEDGARCAICGRSPAQGIAKMQEVRQHQKEEAAKRLKNEKIRKEKEMEELTSTGIADTPAVLKFGRVGEVVKVPAGQPVRPPRTASKGTPSKEDFIRANAAEIGGYLNAHGLKATCEKYKIGNSTIYHYQTLGLLPFVGRGRRTGTQKPSENIPGIIPDQAPKAEPGAIAAVKEGFETIATACDEARLDRNQFSFPEKPVETGANSSKPLETGANSSKPLETEQSPNKAESSKTHLTADLQVRVKVIDPPPALPKFRWWWHPSVQRKWLEVVGELNKAARS